MGPLAIKTLLVTNDFPPTVGGIQSYLRDFVATLPPEDIVVFASTQDVEDSEQFDQRVRYKVVRWPHRVMLPTPGATRRVMELIRSYSIDTLWFGAAAPLGLMASAGRRAGVSRVVVSTHGHEVGWAAVPGARQLLRRIGNQSDVVTYISEYTLGHLRSVLNGSDQWVHLPSGVDSEAFRVGVETQPPTVVCISRLVPRKGQDWLISTWQRLRPSARLLIVGEGAYERSLKRQARGNQDIVFTGRLPLSQMREVLSSATIFAMPCRTRLGGLDVEGLGIVFLEAQASGVPVIAGDSGGAPETVTTDSGIVVHTQEELDRAVLELLADPERRRAMGEAGRCNVLENWSWEIMGQRLQGALGYER